MELIRHIHIRLFVTIIFLLHLGSCEQQRQLVSNIVDARDSEHRAAEAASARPTSLVVKKDETQVPKEQAPILDVPIDNALSDGDGPRPTSSPYQYPFLGGSGGGGGARLTHSEIDDQDMHMLLHWNEMAIDTSGVDHNLPPGLSTLAVREQMGPGRASRAMAIVHIAIFEVVNAIKGGYESYVGLPPVTEETSLQAAIAIAAFDTLVDLFPSQEATLLYQKELDLQAMADDPAKERGIELGHNAALAILTMRENDGSHHAEPVVGIDFIPSNDPGKWRKDPVSNIPIALGALWGTVTPFVMTSGDQFRVPVPPALTSDEYTEAYNEVKSLGGDGVITPTNRTAEQTEIGRYWAYDGVPSLCAPPRLYNQIVVKVAKKKGTDMVGTARLLALVNVAMADATMAIWESKYFYQLWRPVTGIRESDAGTGPSLIGDGNPSTVGDISFTPLGAPASNIPDGIDFTPPFPAYPSGHAGMGGAAFEILRKFYGSDRIDLTFVSDEFDGKTKDSNGTVRPLRPRTFTSFSQMEEENGQSRIYLGIHWVFDKTHGIAQGNQVADYIWDRIFTPTTN